MNTEKSGRNRPRKKTLGYVCVTLAIFITCIYRKRKHLSIPESATGAVLQEKLFKKFLNIHRKTPVLESPFNGVAGLKAYNFIKRDSNTATKVFSCKCCTIFKNTYSEEDLRTTAFGIPAYYC